MPDASNPVDQAHEHRRLAAMQMIGATGVDDEPIRRIGGDDWRVTQRPESEAVECGRVVGRIELEVDETGNKDLRLARRHADPQARVSRGRVERQHLAAATLPAEQDDRRVSRRRRCAEFAAQPIGRPCRQIERDDPSHHRNPLQSRRSPQP
jgi:2',3'-cyclic-nucleotide 2'-phosphodiesterase (5'-nucleotidase family)